MTQEIKIGVSGDSSGAARAIDQLDQAGQKLVKTIERVEQGAGRAGAAIDGMGAGTAATSGVRDGSGRNPAKEYADATRDAARGRQQAQQETQRAREEQQRQAESRRAEVHLMQQDLSAARGRQVSEGDAERSLDRFYKGRDGRGIGFKTTRQFDSYANWRAGLSSLYKKPGQAGRAQAGVYASIMQDTDDVREHGGPIGPSEGGGGGGGSGGGGGGGGGVGQGVARAGSTAMSFVKGMAIFAGLRSIGSMVGTGISSAQDEAISTDTLKRRLGDLGVDFENLRNQTRMASQGLGLTYVETVRLGQQFASTAGNLRAGDAASGGFGRTIATAGGFARSYGIDPSQSMELFATARRTGADGGNDAGDRRLALMISDSIQNSGYIGKADEIVAAITNFSDQQARFAIQSPNVGAFSGAMSSLMTNSNGLLDPAGASSLLGSADSAFRRGGAKGEASKMAIYTALTQANPGISPIEVQALIDGGMFASAESTFGDKGGATKGMYKGDNGKLSKKTNFDVFSDFLRKRYSDPEWRDAAISGVFGGSIAQSRMLDGMKDEEGHASLDLLSRAGVNPSSVNPTGLKSISAIAGAKNRGDLKGIYGNLMGRADIGKDQKSAMTTAVKGGNFNDIQETMARAAASGQEQTEGSQTRTAVTDMSNKLGDIGSHMLEALNAIRTVATIIADKIAPDRMSAQREDEAAKHIDYAGFVKSGDRYKGVPLGGVLASFDRDALDFALKSDNAKIAAMRSKTPGGKLDESAIASVLGFRPPEGTSGSVFDIYMARRQNFLAAAAPPESGPAGGATDADWNHVGAPGAASAGKASGAAAPDRIRKAMAAKQKEMSAPSPYDALFQAAGKKYGVNWLDLKRIAIMESDIGKKNQPGPSALGHSALGIMQVWNPDAQARMGANWRDPATNIDEGARIYAQKLKAAGGSTHGALRAYNGTGPAAEAYANEATSLTAGSEAQNLHVHFAEAPIVLKNENGHTVGKGSLKPMLAPAASGTR